MKRTQGRHLPALANLVALTTVARTGNITHAARELFLTQSAVSRQIKDLETFAGRQLLERKAGEVTLTVDGRRYVAIVIPLLNQLEEATMALSTSRPDAGHLTVSSQTTFAVKWLLPRLSSFHQKYPRIIVNVETHLGQQDLLRTSADALILFREHGETGWSTDWLRQGGGRPVCAPALLAQSGLAARKALSGLPLLHQRASPKDWPNYFRSLGLPEEGMRSGPTYSLLTMGLQAALSGLGVALLPDYVTEEDLKAGRLVQVVDEPFVKKESYCLMIENSKRGSEPIEKFRSWLIEECAERP